MGIGHSEFLRIQLIAASTRVTITLLSLFESKAGWKVEDEEWTMV